MKTKEEIYGEAMQNANAAKADMMKRRLALSKDILKLADDRDTMTRSALQGVADAIAIRFITL